MLSRRLAWLVLPRLLLLLLPQDVPNSKTSAVYQS